MVTVFDPLPPGHSQGSSHGRQKIVRRAYPDRLHTRLLVEAHPLWGELEQASGARFLHECGLLYIGREGTPNLPAMCAALDEVGARWAPDAPPTHPMRLADDERAAFVPEAGWVDTDAALQATLSLAERAGAQFVRERVGALGELGSFDLVVVTAGGWAVGLAGVRARPTLQTSAYLRGHYDGPVWIEGFGAEMYGFPNAPGEDAFKVGYHAEGPAADMGASDRPTDPGQTAAIVELAARRFGLPADAVGEPFACVYTRSEGDRFQIGWSDRRTIVVSPCSGHGYKFAPWVGRLVAGIAAGTAEPPPEFALQ